MTSKELYVYRCGMCGTLKARENRGKVAPYCQDHKDSRRMKIVGTIEIEEVDEDV